MGTFLRDQDKSEMTNSYPAETVEFVAPCYRSHRKDMRMES